MAAKHVITQQPTAHNIQVHGLKTIYGPLPVQLLAGKPTCTESELLTQLRVRVQGLERLCKGLRGELASDSRCPRTRKSRRSPTALNTTGLPAAMYSPNFPGQRPRLYTVDGNGTTRTSQADWKNG